ncbi:ATP-binding protein, partial [Slackia isoflavoniconvertens]|uniref:ATP-binding protein n=1 Tax=Slackia isoflavoniconvertens TaxID=572010 RepID=UPI001C694689
MTKAARRRRRRRQWNRGRFRFIKTLADFDWSFQPSVPRAKVEELATLRFMDS